MANVVEAHREAPEEDGEKRDGTSAAMIRAQTAYAKFNRKQRGGLLSTGNWPARRSRTAKSTWLGKESSKVHVPCLSSFGFCTSQPSMPLQ